MPLNARIQDQLAIQPAFPDFLHQDLKVTRLAVKNPTSVFRVFFQFRFIIIIYIKSASFKSNQFIKYEFSCNTSNLYRLHCFKICILSYFFSSSNLHRVSKFCCCTLFCSFAALCFVVLLDRLVKRWTMIWGRFKILIHRSL